MLFVGQHRNIPVPQVYAIFSDEDSKINFIVMEHIEGKTLAAHWDLLDTPAKTSVASRLRDFMKHLHEIPCPGYFGSLGYRGLEDSMFWTADNEAQRALNGPFETEAALKEAMISKWVYNNMQPQKDEYYRRVLPLTLEGHGPIFSHAGFQRKNIMIRTDGTLFIIDWETAGWYPSYWGYTLAMFTCDRWDDDWHVWLAGILDEFPNEYAWMDMLRRELWF